MIFAPALALVLCGCTYQNLTDTCVFPSKAPLYETEASALRMLVAWPHSVEKHAPFLSLYDTNEEPLMTVGLMEVASDSTVVLGAAAPNCGRAETHEYSLVIDEDDWVSYWRTAKESGEFSAGVAMPGVEPVMRRDSIGFGLADVQTGEFYWVCGCLAR
jgi:hypothetical protein